MKKTCINHPGTNDHNTAECPWNAEKAHGLTRGAAAQKIECLCAGGVAGATDHSTAECPVIRAEDLEIDTYAFCPAHGFDTSLARTVRVTHKPTGISVERGTERSQHANRLAAQAELARLVALNGASQPVREQSKIDAERAAFEAAYPELVGRCRWSEERQQYSSGSKGLGWQDGLKAGQWLAVWRKARASLPVGVPDGFREAHVVGFKPGMGEVTLYVGRLPVWLDMGHTCYVSAAPAAPTVKAEQVRYSAGDLQKEALNAGLQYVRESDDHYVTGTTEQALDFIRNMIGVDIRLTDPAPSPSVKAEQCMPCGGWGVIAAEPGDPVTACEHCNKAPSLPAAGSAVADEAWLQEWARDKFTYTGRYKGQVYGNTDWALARALHADIATALSAQQSAPEPAMGQTGKLERFRDLAEFALREAGKHNLWRQREALAREFLCLVDAIAAEPERVSVPEGWRIVEKPTCFALLDGNQVVATLAGPEAEENAAIIAALLASHGRVSVPEGQALVPLKFVQGFNTLAHNYSLRAVPPDYYDGMAGDAFRDAYARCGRDLAELRALLASHGRG